MLLMLHEMANNYAARDDAITCYVVLVEAQPSMDLVCVIVF
jgi:hypothetical protein